MTALTDLLAKVDGERYERPDGGTKRYHDFARDIEAAGIGPRVQSVLMDALHRGCAKYVLRALIAKEGQA
jgi:hypothetical protein